MKNINTLILIAMLTIVASLITTQAFASSVYQLSNCTAEEATASKKQVDEIQKAVKDGYMSQVELAAAQVFHAEVSLCAGQISKADACALMTKNQSTVAAAGMGRFEEARRMILIRDFCQ